MRILHVIESLGRGGASRSLLALAERTRRRHRGWEGVLPLRGADGIAASRTRAAGLALVDARDDASVRREVAAADLLHVHFWNTPELYAWLRRPRAASRLILTLHVAGEHPAQVVTPRVVEAADLVVATSPYTAALPALRAAAGRGAVEVLRGACEMSRLAGEREGNREEFIVAYVGTVGFVKLHPRFLEMCAAARIARARFAVVGDGDAVPTLRRRTEALGASGRFDWRGWTDDVGAVLRGADVFGYPLRVDSYATSDLALQEAMAAGVPPVILDHGALPYLVQHGETGLVVPEEQYPAALERLHDDAAERHRLGENARAYARRSFDADALALRLDGLYERVAAYPRSEPRWSEERRSPWEGADFFLAALGDRASEFLASLTGADAEAAAAEETIAGASPVVTDAAAGGVLHYRRAYPRDPFLRLWSGLVLERQGRPALAAAEFHQAQELGLAHPRLERYLQRSLRQAR